MRVEVDWLRRPGARAANEYEGGKARKKALVVTESLQSLLSGRSGVAAKPHSAKNRRRGIVRRHPRSAPRLSLSAPAAGINYHSISIGCCYGIEVRGGPPRFDRIGVISIRGDALPPSTS